MRLFRKLSYLIILLVSLHYIEADYFSSISGLEKLLSLEVHYLESLENHIQEVEKFNKEIERFLVGVEVEQLKIQNDTTQYFEDPINAFKAVKRFSVDWKQMEDLTQQIQAIPVYKESLSLLPENITLPTAEDLKGASRGMSRLQHIYKFKSADIVEGQLGNSRHNTKLTSSDCFLLGQSLYESKDNLYASEWLIEAMHKLEDEDTYGIEAFGLDGPDHEEVEAQSNFEDNSQKKIGNEQILADHEETATNSEEVGLYPFVSNLDILEFLGAALYNAGNRRLAIIMNNKLLALDPENPYGLKNKALFENGIKEERRLRLLKKPASETKLNQLCAQVCSGELQQSPGEKRNLRCRYVTNNVPYYFVGPVKMEELNLDPFVAFYHQVISDNEVDHIIEAALEYILERSEVGDADHVETSDVRVSKGAWLYHEDHPNLKKLSKRLQDITGLSMESGEPLQVANYGIGGHYESHMDSSEIPDIDYPGQGNRLLTALLFINEVELGGATAFPILHLAVPPLKNNLLVWYNLHKSGEMDYRTAHAGCPVIKGSKWIANKWFHTVGQELKRPCDTKSNADVSKQYKDYDIDD